MTQGVRIASSLVASSLRGWRGTVARAAARQPEKPLELHEIEGCPYCRLVREALTELDLDALILPCPRGGERFRPRVEELGGKRQFPFLVDPNSATRLYESDAIVAYLYGQYAGRAPPVHRVPRALHLTASGAATLVRAMNGLRCLPSRAPEQPLELYSFESSPFSRLVRECLCELEMPYLLRSMGKATRADMGPPWVRSRFYADAPVEGRNRKRMQARTGRLQVPYLIDPNTGAEMYESADIRQYLLRTYLAP